MANVQISGIRAIAVGLIAFSLLFAINGCQRQTPADVIFEPTGEVSPYSTFRLRLSQPLAPSSIEQLSGDVKPIEFEPPIEGEFLWEDDQTLVFHPHTPLEPNQQYTAHLTPGFKKLIGPAAVEKTFTFHTPYINITRIDLFWEPNPSGANLIDLKVNLVFNYPVDPRQVLDKLEVNIEGNRVKNIRSVSTATGNIIPVEIPQVVQLDREQKLQVTVKKGLKPQVGAKSLEEDRVFELTIPAKAVLAIRGVEGGTDGERRWIDVFTTEKVDIEELSKYVSVRPETKLEFTVTPNAFRISGDFGDLASVSLFIRKGLKGINGSELTQDFQTEVAFGEVEPYLRFADKRGIYLLKGGQENLVIHSTGVRKAVVKVYQIYPVNAVHFIRDNRSFFRQGYDYWGRYLYYRNYGSVIYQDTLELSNKTSGLNTTLFKVKGIIHNGIKGLYGIEIRDIDDYWRRDAKIVVVSDLGIIARATASQMMVFVNTLSDVKPVAGAQVEVLSVNNYTMGTAATDAQGVAAITIDRNMLPDSALSLVMVNTPGDFNILELRSARIGTSRFDVGGLREVNDQYLTYIYGDRDIYRPGETVHMVAILRHKDLSTPVNVPVKIAIKDARNVTAFHAKANTSEEGAVEFNFQLADYAPTGTYTALFYTGNGDLLNTLPFKVETFLPDKIRLNISVDKEIIQPVESNVIRMQGIYHFGVPAANASYQLIISAIPHRFRSSRFPDFRFDNSSIRDNFETIYYEGELDDKGESNLQFTPDTSITAGGYHEVVVNATVFDVTGRPVHNSTAFNLYPNRWYPGIYAPGYYFSTGSPVPFRFIAVDHLDRPAQNLTATIEWVRYEWQTVLKKNYSGRYYYDSERKEIPVDKRNITINGSPVEARFTPVESGSYQVRMYYPGSKHYVSYDFYVYGFNAAPSAFEVDREGRIEITTDKAKYQPGETARILFKAPFSGRMLVTFEGEDNIDYRYIDVTNNSAEITMNIPESAIPNFYVTATLVKPHAASYRMPSPLFVAHGFAPVSVEDPGRNLKVDILAPEKIKPNTTQEITVKTNATGPVHVTLAVVDEGILQLTDFESPDPYKYMYARRALKSIPYDMYKWLLPEAVNAPGTTGSGEGELRKRQNPVQTQRYNPLAWWSGVVKTNVNGEARFRVNIPQFNGETRLMAVAFQGNRFGAAAKPMKIASDIVIMPAVPRTLTLGDSIYIPVSLMNTKPMKQRVRVSLKAAGPFTISGATTLNAEIEPNGMTTVEFRLIADKQTGKGELLFMADNGETVSERIEIGVKPPGPPVNDYYSGVINNGDAITIPAPDGFIEGLFEGTVVVSNIPAVRLAGQFKTLLQYPHGCLEQTISKAFPQIYLDKLAMLVAPDMYKRSNPVYYVNEAIRKVESMQLYDGSFAYWPGGGSSNDWTSVYATHFLLEAGKAGYDVRSSVLNKAVDYLATLVREKPLETYYTPRPGGYTTEMKASKTALYALYVLSLAEQPDYALMNKYLVHPEWLTNDGRFLLAGAFALAKEWNKFYSLIRNGFIPEKTLRKTGGDFDSEIRANALILNVLASIDPTNKMVFDVMNYLVNRADQISTTQEKAFVFLSLGKIAAHQAGKSVSVDIMQNGKTIKSFTGRDVVYRWTNPGAGTLRLTARGDEGGYAFYYVNYTGLKSKGKLPERDANLSIRRSFYNIDGQRIIDNVFKQNQLVVCKLELNAIHSVENIAITEIIPSGFEIENPRLSKTPTIPWIPENEVDYFDIRDDRILFYLNLEAGQPQEVYYMLRAVNRGKYVLPAAQAEAMYNLAYYSLHGGGKVIINPSSAVHN